MSLFDQFRTLPALVLGPSLVTGSPYCVDSGSTVNDFFTSLDSLQISDANFGPGHTNVMVIRAGGFIAVFG